MMTTGLLAAQERDRLGRGMAAEPSTAMRVDPGGELAHGPGEVGLALGEQQHDALAVARPRGVSKPDEQLGVVGAGELGQDQAVRLVLAHGQAAGRAQRHVVELLDGVEHLLRVFSRDRPAPWRTRETVAMETPARSATE